MRDNVILSRHIKPAARELGIGFVNWQVLRRSYATSGEGQRKGCARPDAAQPGKHDSGRLSAGGSGVAAQGGAQPNRVRKIVSTGTDRGLEVQPNATKLGNVGL
ncbi:MAG TPA: hypothetical protein VKY31_16685 [Terriglobia bacterium]|nr:hypothetical protein [Terriglobia bacterium]